MKNLKVIFILIFLAMIIFSCNNEGDEVVVTSEIPDCIQDMIDQTEDLRVLRQDIDGQTHYWLNTGANAFDGDEQIVNDVCEEVCIYAGWINPPCTENYINDDWEQINP